MFNGKFAFFKDDRLNQFFNHNPISFNFNPINFDVLNLNRCVMKKK